MTPDQYCQQKAARSGSSLHYALLFLAPEKRRAVTAVHAFCREVGAVADEVKDVGVARTKLAWWRTEVADLLSGHPHHPVARALEPFAASAAFDAASLNEIIDGAERDLAYHRYADFEALRAYCHLAGGIRATICARLLGTSEAAALAHAEALGVALQLAALIRDVGHDARHGRVYFPVDELGRFGLTAEDVLALRGGEPFTRLLDFQVTRTATLLQESAARLAEADRAQQRPGLILAAIHQALLEEVRREGDAVLHQRIDLTPLRKLWLAWRTWART